MTRTHTYGQAGTAEARARTEDYAEGIGAREAADLVSVSRETLAKAWRSGDLPMLGLVGDAAPRFDPEAVKAWARKKRLIA